MNKPGVNKQPTLCVAAGKSGGHLIPALELAKRWLNENPTGRVVVFSNKTELDATIIKQYPWVSCSYAFHISTFYSKKFWRYPLIAAQVAKAWVQSLYYMWQIKPTHIISTGGLVSLPVCAAGRLLGSTVAVYELNVVPGKALHALAYVATTINIVFAKTRTYFNRSAQAKCTVTDYPIRFNEQDCTLSKSCVREQINTGVFGQCSQPFSEERKTIFLLGGSQGSSLLNKLIKNLIITEPALHTSLQIIHQTGSDNLDWLSFYHQYNVPALPFSFNKDIHNFYNLADGVVARAGAGTLFELLFFRKRTLIIPLVAGTTSHQCDNAHELMSLHPSIFSVLEQADVHKNQTLFNNAIKQLLGLE